MRFSLLLFACLAVATFGGCKQECKCGCSNCGKSCVNQCDGVRCIPGDKCCDSCTCKK